MAIARARNSFLFHCYRGPWLICSFIHWPKLHSVNNLWSYDACLVICRLSLASDPVVESDTHTLVWAGFMHLAEAQARQKGIRTKQPKKSCSKACRETYFYDYKSMLDLHRPPVCPRTLSSFPRKSASPSATDVTAASRATNLQAANMMHGLTRQKRWKPIGGKKVSG